MVALAACSPALNWRIARPDGGNVELLFPCRADRQVRNVRINGIDASMQMDSCHADGATFSLAFVDAADAQVTPMVRALREKAVANIDGTPSTLALAVPGATPSPDSLRLRIGGRLADGRTVVEETAFFIKGRRVYQATVLGESPSADAADIFFTSIKMVR